MQHSPRSRVRGRRSLACAPPEAAPYEAAADTAWVARRALRGLRPGLLARRGPPRRHGWPGPHPGDGRERDLADAAHPRGSSSERGRWALPTQRATTAPSIPPSVRAADLLALVDAVHGRGMKLILDWVPEPYRGGPRLGAGASRLLLPRLRRQAHPADQQRGKPTDWTDVAELDYGNPALRAAMIDEMTWWLREYDLDGFRVDVAGFVPYDFWREAVPALRAAVPRRILCLPSGATWRCTGWVRPDLWLGVVQPAQGGLGQRAGVNLRHPGARRP